MSLSPPASSPSGPPSFHDDAWPSTSAGIAGTCVVCPGRTTQRHLKRPPRFDSPAGHVYKRINQKRLFTARCAKNSKNSLFNVADCHNFSLTPSSAAASAKKAQTPSAGPSMTADPDVMVTGDRRIQVGKKRLCKTKGIVLPSK